MKQTTNAQNTRDITENVTYQPSTRRRFLTSVTAIGIGASILPGLGLARNQNSTNFTVRIGNVSQPQTLDTDRVMGTVPLSPGAWAVYRGSNLAFQVGKSANKGTELIAEDGFPGGSLPSESGGLADTLAETNRVSDSGVFAAPGGMPDNPALFTGETTEFSFTATKGDRLTLETMFVQSNDWFYGLNGLKLFMGNTPISGDVTSKLGLYDAGTEVDAPPGEGPTSPPGAVQKPVQDPMATNVGTDENELIQLASERHLDYSIPATTDVVKVTIMPQEEMR
jgi:Spondin_N